MLPMPLSSIIEVLPFFPPLSLSPHLLSIPNDIVWVQSQPSHGLGRQQSWSSILDFSHLADLT